MTKFRKIFSYVHIALLVYIWAISAIEMFSLPAKIPLHFDFTGKIDVDGSKYSLFVGAFIATCIYALTLFLSKNPDTTLLHMPEKMRNNKKISALFVKMIAFYILLLFAIVTTEIIFIAKGHYDRLSPLPNVILVLMFISILGFFIYARKKLHTIHKH